MPYRLFPYNFILILKTLLITGLLLLEILSCKKFITVAPPPNQLITSDVFSDEATADATIAGIYSSMTGEFGFNFASGALTAYPGLSADELLYANNMLLEFQNNGISTTNPQLKGIWDNAYSYIYQANAALEGLSKATALPEQSKNELTGEGKFIRAFCYFYLVNLFGDVPLVTGTDYQINNNLPRKSVSDIYRLIASDLTEAESLLSTEYLVGEKARPNKWAASALLARAYLYQKDWADAISEASKVIGSGQYILDPPAGIFLKNSNEAIWQLIPVAYGLTWDAFYFIPFSGIPNYQLTNQLLQSFEQGDQRFQNWIDSADVGGHIYYYPYKYKSNQFFASVEYETVLRLGEMYLIRAEAWANQDMISDAQADLNIIRHRAGLPGTNAIDRESMLLAIAHERRIEFFAEWGHRWFDLKRTNRATIELSYKQGWNITDTLYPIPQLEIQNNPALGQNAGY